MKRHAPVFLFFFSGSQTGPHRGGLHVDGLQVFSRFAPSPCVFFPSPSVIARLSLRPPAVLGAGRPLNADVVAPRGGINRLGAVCPLPRALLEMGYDV